MNRLEGENSGSVALAPRGLRRYVSVLWETLVAFWNPQTFRLAAATTFFAILSMAPLFVLILTIAGTQLDRETVGRQLVEDVRRIAGPQAADVAMTIVEHANHPPPSNVTLFLGFATVLFGATGVFTQLQDSLNLIWGVESVPGRGLWRFFRARLISLIMVLGFVCLLLILPLLTAVVTVVNAHLMGRIPQIAAVWQYLPLLVSMLVWGFVFAAIFKVLPHVATTWSDVWIGAAATALMFTLGQYVIGIYLGYSGVGLAYGAAGSLVVLLVWIYCSSMILFLGAEFTHVYACRFGSHSSGRSSESLVTRTGFPPPKS